MEVSETNKVWHTTEPVVEDDAIYVPLSAYYLDGESVNYRKLITKEVFIEAYKKWILGEES